MLTSARGEKLLQIRKTPRFQVLAPQGPREGEEEHTHRHTFDGLCRGKSDRIRIHVFGEGGSGGRYGEKERWENDRRERENGEKHGGGG